MYIHTLAGRDGIDGTSHMDVSGFSVRTLLSSWASQSLAARSESKIPSAVAIAVEKQGASKLRLCGQWSDAQSRASVKGRLDGSAHPPALSPGVYYSLLLIQAMVSAAPWTVSF